MWTENVCYILQSFSVNWGGESQLANAWFAQVRVCGVKQMILRKPRFSFYRALNQKASMKMEFLRHEAKANDDIKNDNSKAH